MELTATPDAGLGTVQLVIEHDQPVTQIMRADANGTRPVRLPAGTLPTATAGTLTVTDYEPALGGLIEYRVLAGSVPLMVRTRIGAGDQPPRFTLPAVPVYNVPVDAVTDYSAGRQSAATEHQVIGRRDPIFTLAGMGTRRGTLRVWCDTLGGARSLETLFERGQVAMYRQTEHPGMDMYLVATSCDTVPDGLAWALSVGYVEVAWPAGDQLLAASWTFDDLAANGGTFDDVAQDYRSFTDLALGDQA